MCGLVALCGMRWPGVHTASSYDVLHVAMCCRLLVMCCACAGGAHQANIVAWMVLRASLPHDDLTRKYELVVQQLDAQVAGGRVRVLPRCASRLLGGCALLLRAPSWEAAAEG